MSERLTREAMFLGMAELVAQRATCPRASVGAVLAIESRPLSIGYNGAPPGLPHCTEVGCEPVSDHVSILPVEQRLTKDELLKEFGCQRTVHAEANAIAYAARAGRSTALATLYATYSPCRKCAELAASAGIVRIVYRKEYRATPWDLLRELGIEMVKWV